MLFSTYWFLIAAAVFLPFYWLVHNPRVRLFLLITFCFIFHAHFAGPAGMAPIIVLAIITFFIGRSRNPTACGFGIALAVLALCFYKYTHFFFSEVFSHIAYLKQWNLEAQANSWLPGAPPLAISFFTFEFIHYLFEVRRGSEPIRSIVDFTQFTFYFPSLVAGPIKRYTQFLPSLHQGLRTASGSDAIVGFGRVLIGFIKKALLADNLTLYINCNGPRFAQISIAERWFLVLAIALRIYWDFSGYSDMAIGLSRMMGITLPPNFNWPYVAKNIVDFWQRWHISLSSWIRDYVYIPLGGSRLGHTRRIINGLIAFALCGLWHGPAWNFIVWGIYHGLGLAVCSSYRTSLGVMGKAIGVVFDRVPLVSWAVTMAFVCFGWLLFFYPVSEAFKMARLLFPAAV